VSGPARRSRITLWRRQRDRIARSAWLRGLLAQPRAPVRPRLSATPRPPARARRRRTSPGRNAGGPKSFQ